MKRLPWPAFAGVGVIALLALAAPVLGLGNPVTMDVAHRLAGPSAAHWLGQDEFGRDVLTRLVWGARVSLSVAFAASALACVIGTALGVLGGFLRGIVEMLTLRSIDVLLCFPPLLLALLVVTLAGPGATTLIPVLALVYLPGFTRVAYAGVLTARSQDYVEAMRVLGAGKGRIMLRTILPNIGGPVLVQFSLAAASAVVLESGLSFLGLGVVPPAPSWGLMIGAARATMVQAPLLLLWPCLALTLTILAMNALCDGLRDAVDPHPAYRTGRRRMLDLLAPGLLPQERAVLDLRGLTVAIDTPAGPIQPVRDVSLQLFPGETLALVGESGSGKSLTSLAVTGLLPGAARVAAGAAWLDGTDLVRLPEEKLRLLRGRTMAMIFQDPSSSLNPVHRVGHQIAEAIQAHRRMAPGEPVELLRRVGIPDPERRVRAFPHELSGGMRQRVMIAIAIANGPRLLIADEPTTALDVTIQAQVLDLLAEFKRQSRLSLLFITHSLPVVAEIADRVAVMYAGEIVEQGPMAEVFARPLHPYTAALLRSAPVEDGPPPEGIPGVVPPPHALPPGCTFAPRCPKRVPACEAAHPALVQVAPGRQTRCIRWDA
ncbi:dipeptide/oligopeptide/nickel ABC transporter permease/ATP-binding protein [Limobrevibacterium gyesilva]|uniref:Dipeptide/oligopeptide/nickel ABC transporter permease/ATP-binding protein n=1 Tax=Limobrevibacterium gyesilva TaxID=2991712 RepID=A0AA41YRW8_9PROT|nr:dipeptide/oligopeptide/nickel ABC transporter permease/ATP-binding protein [Limobrevibacterium gyesilva]MCW3475390.1 dipeptide/oligopeptide/nickel ABC transporter permease/ATP-binding protein [Limobrevibacterium gyesilva]